MTKMAMAWKKANEERKNLTFFKIFQSADLSSESMRALPFSFMRKLSPEDFSYKMVMKTDWGRWEVEISKNPRFYYMEKLGWNNFVSENLLGENEFVTFTHKGKMRFTVNIYGQNGREIVKPRKLPSMTPPNGVKKEDVEIKEEEIGESMGGVEFGVRKKKEVKRSKKVEKKKSKKVVKGKRQVEVRVPSFNITITSSYLKFLAIPKHFTEEYAPSKSTLFSIHHPDKGIGWQVYLLVRETRAIFSGGWSKLAREFPLEVGDKCTFKLINSTEFVLKKRREFNAIE